MSLEFHPRTFSSNFSGSLASFLTKIKSNDFRFAFAEKKNKKQKHTYLIAPSQLSLRWRRWPRNGSFVLGTYFPHESADETDDPTGIFSPLETNRLLNSDFTYSLLALVIFCIESIDWEGKFGLNETLSPLKGRLNFGTKNSGNVLCLFFSLLFA